MTVYDQKLYVWCVASIRDTIGSRIKNSLNDTIHTFYEADLRTTNTKPECIEVRIDGPTFLKEGTKNELSLRVEINLFVKTTFVETELYRHQKNVGIAVAALMSDICVKELGYPDADESFVGTFQLQQPGVVVAEHGQVDPNSKNQQATIEAHYEMCHYVRR